MNYLKKIILHRKWVRRKKEIDHYLKYPFANSINCEIKNYDRTC